MKSTVTLNITFEHSANLPVDAGDVASAVASFLAETYGPGRLQPVKKVGFRGYRKGPENGESTYVFLQSAVFARYGKV